MSRFGFGNSSITVVAVSRVGFNAAVSANRKTLLIGRATSPGRSGRASVREERCTTPPQRAPILCPNRRPWTAETSSGSAYMQAETMPARLWHQLEPIWDHHVTRRNVVIVVVEEDTFDDLPETLQVARVRVENLIHVAGATCVVHVDAD